MDYVLPRHSGLRQWVLTFPFAWRPALGRDGALLGSLTRIFEQTVQGFYARRAREGGQLGAKTGSVTVLQRTSSDLRLNPHVHSVFLDGVWHEQEDELVFVGLGHLRTGEMGAVLAHTIRRIERHLLRRGVLPGNEDVESPAEPALLAADRIRKRVEPEVITYDGRRIDVTISAGVATLADRSRGSARSLLEAADAALYRAKRQGRNRTASVEMSEG